MATHEKYILKVTAGPTYEAALKETVKVNTTEPFHISTDQLDARVHVRIKDYRGLPAESPSTSPYFSHASHTYDRYSISFTFRPKKTFKGNELVFGNDFDHPIRDRLPPGFDWAFGIVKRFVDPGLYGDPRAEEPYLYGPLLSSINVLRVGTKTEAKTQEEVRSVLKKAEESSGETSGEGDDTVYVVSEGADEGEGALREELGVPDAHGARQTFFLTEEHRNKWTWEEGRTYSCDFFNPYLDFNDFSLKLGGGWMPTYTLPIVKHWDGQPLRYVLKDRTTNKELFVVIFTLLPKETLDEAEAKAAGNDKQGEDGKDVKDATTAATKADDDDID